MGIIGCSLDRVVRPADRAPAARASEPIRVLYWDDDTARANCETGVQRVTRRLADALSASGATVVPIGWNAKLRRVEVRATGSERENRPLDAVARDRAMAGTVLFVPEIPLSLIQEGLDPIQLGRAYGVPTAALVHDLIPVKLAADYPAPVVALFRRYFEQFARADLVLATTRYVADDLRHHLRGEGLLVPRIEVAPLPAEFPDFPRRRERLPPPNPAEPLRLVAVTTWEPRKNLVRLLQAIRSLAGDPLVSLDLVGRRGAFPSYDEQVLDIASSTPGVTIRGPLTDAALAALYETCHASVYPSLEEGFGLPIGESLWLGRPCLCHNGSSMAESALGGGALAIDMRNEAAIAGALRRLATDKGLSSRLALEAALRPLRTWSDLGQAVSRHLSTVACRAYSTVSSG